MYNAKPEVSERRIEELCERVFLFKKRHGHHLGIKASMIDATPHEIDVLISRLSESVDQVEFRKKLV